MIEGFMSFYPSFTNVSIVWASSWAVPNCLLELTHDGFLKHSPHLISPISRYGSNSEA